VLKGAVLRFRKTGSLLRAHFLTSFRQSLFSFLRLKLFDELGLGGISAGYETQYFPFACN
jgi:hypothetical protein